MSNLPALRNLALENVRWDDSPGSPLKFLSFDLRALSLDFGKQCPIEGVIYLHRLQLGDHLRHLHLKCESDEQINQSLAFPPVDAVRLNVLDASSEMAVSPSLTLILGVHTDSINRPLQWTPFPQFVQLLDAPQFSTVWEISFVVNGSPFCLRSSARHARAYFELLLPAVLPARTDRRDLSTTSGSSAPSLRSLDPHPQTNPISPPPLSSPLSLSLNTLLPYDASISTSQWNVPDSPTKHTEAAVSIVIVLVDLPDEGDEQLERGGSLSDTRSPSSFPLQWDPVVRTSQAGASPTPSRRRRMMMIEPRYIA
ncbi:hypothetical protein DFH08DRAFT_802263 [Mycena albidolilacea]|uniref:Uncharacterized protein n=1 Tax=Mycena albidolilacea TaxID=1033008 RepID=A0AAD7EYQ0_9AGAR|nr:hypothetical protein DFH08DRAFT_802263 [Mycena albidolilacea]